MARAGVAYRFRQDDRDTSQNQRARSLGGGRVREELPTSPRPTFDEPAHLARRDVTLHLWGDEQSGRVADWIYVSSGLIHQLVFGLPPGGSFRHSDRFRTVFAADELLHVVNGAMAIVNPSTGESHRVETGESVFFRRDTWHHVFGFGPDALRVLEFFAPPPSSGASSAYARNQSLLENPVYRDSRWLTDWPMSRFKRAEDATMTFLNERDLLWQTPGYAGVLYGIAASTEHITVASVTLQPGSVTPIMQYAGDLGAYVVDGTVHLQLDEPTSKGLAWFEGIREDGFFVPAGFAHCFHNVGGEPVRLMMAVAPGEPLV
jgi:quercetin dioxygenase-like cupin family protein